jgi:hypothetical protein
MNDRFAEFFCVARRAHGNILRGIDETKTEKGDRSQRYLAGSFVAAALSMMRTTSRPSRKPDGAFDENACVLVGNVLGDK